jgi:hypothetical protein
LETQEPIFRDELVALKDWLDRGEIERAQQEASEPLVTSLIAVGNGKDLWSTLNRYFAAGCTRLAVAAYPRDRVSVERLLKVLAGGPAR